MEATGNGEDYHHPNISYFSVYLNTISACAVFLKDYNKRHVECYVVCPERPNHLLRMDHQNLEEVSPDFSVLFLFEEC